MPTFQQSPHGEWFEMDANGQIYLGNMYHWCEGGRNNAAAAVAPSVLLHEPGPPQLNYYNPQQYLNWYALPQQQALVFYHPPPPPPVIAAPVAAPAVALGPVQAASNLIGKHCAIDNSICQEVATMRIERHMSGVGGSPDSAVLGYDMRSGI